MCTVCIALGLACTSLLYCTTVSVTSNYARKEVATWSLADMSIMVTGVPSSGMRRGEFWYEYLRKQPRDRVCTCTRLSEWMRDCWQTGHRLAAVSRLLSSSQHSLPNLHRNTTLALFIYTASFWPMTFRTGLRQPPQHYIHLNFTQAQPTDSNLWLS